MTSFSKYSKVMENKYNSDAKFRAMVNEVAESKGALDDELLYGDGWTFEDNSGALENAGNQWNTAGLWSVGMTDSKTQRVNAKMIKVT